MARTALTPIDIPASYDATGVALTWSATDPANGNYFVATGREIILIRNDDVASQTLTVSSVDDPYGRSESWTKAVAAAAYACSQLFPIIGYRQTNGQVYIDSTDADLKVCILRLP